MTGDGRTDGTGTGSRTETGSAGVAALTRPALAGGSYRLRMLGSLSLGWAALQWGRFLLPPLLPRIRASLSLSAAEAGLALAAFTLVYAVVQYPSGTSSDTLSRATLLLPGFLILLAGFALVGLAVLPWLFLVGLLLLGLGKGLFASPSRALLGELFADRRGRALGVYSAGTDVGGLLAAGLAVAVVGVGWRVAFLPVVACLALTALLFVAWNRESYVLARPRVPVRGTVRRVVATRDQRERLVAFALFFFAIGGLINFYPTLLAEAGFSERLSSGVFALLFAVGLLVKPVGGTVSDRYPRLLVSVAGLALSVCGLAAVLLAGGLPVVAAGTVLLAVGYKTQFPIVDSAVMEAAPEGSVGGDLGAARALFLTTNAAGPGVVGVVAEAAAFALAFWLLAGAFALAGFVLLNQHRRA